MPSSSLSIPIADPGLICVPPPTSSKSTFVPSYTSAVLFPRLRKFKPTLSRLCFLPVPGPVARPPMVTTPRPELVPLLEEEKILGKYLITQVLSVGKQEQMMPMLTSRLLHSAAIGLSQLMSSDTDTACSDCRRSRETIHVIPPRQNTNVTASFCRLGRFKLLMTGRGRTAIATSVKMLRAALTNLDQR